MLKISVVIPLYNKEPHISRALDSVISQTVQEFEIIVVDDGSTDNSAEVVKKYKDSRLRLIKQKNQGVSAARNTGIQEAKAEMIAFLDADDEWKPTFLETILRLRTKYQEAGAYATMYEKYDQYGPIKQHYKTLPSAPWEGLIENYFLSCVIDLPIICSSSICIPKNVFQSVGMFPLGVLLGEDLDMWGRIALKYPIAVSREICAVYHCEAVERACNKKILIKEYTFAKTAFLALQSENVQINQVPYLKEYIAKLEISSAIRNLTVGNNKSAFKILTRCNTELFKSTKYKYLILSILPPILSQSICRVKNTLNKKY